MESTPLPSEAADDPNAAEDDSRPAEATSETVDDDAAESPGSLEASATIFADIKEDYLAVDHQDKTGASRLATMGA